MKFLFHFSRGGINKLAGGGFFLALQGAFFLLMPLVSVASPIHPYGVPGPGVFATSVAGRHTGNGVGIFSLDNTGIVFPGETDTHVNIGASMQSAMSAYTAGANTANASAMANFGVIKIFAQFDEQDYLGTHLVGFADAGWIDTLTFSDPALNGQQGLLTFLLSANGTLFAGGNNGLAGMSVGFSEGVAGGAYGAQGQANSQPGDYNQTVNETYVFQVPFIFGTPFEMYIRAIATAGLSSTPFANPSSGQVNFSNSFYWAGIQSVTSNGNLVTGWTLVSASGTNYNQSFVPIEEVPEPGTAPLLAAVLGGVLLFRRFKR